MRNYIAEEPVRFWAAVTGLFFAVLAALVGFGVIALTEAQIGLLLAVMTAAGVLFQFFFVRERVSPVG